MNGRGTCQGCTGAGVEDIEGYGINVRLQAPWGHRLHGVKSLQAVEKLTIRPGLIPGYAMHDPLFAEDSDEEEQEKQAAGGQWLPYHFFAFLWSLP